MRRSGTLVLTLMAALIAQSPASALPDGAIVPNFSFLDFSGKSKSFHDYRGHVVLVDFWATWCRPCIADIPHLKELYASYHARGFDIIGMDSETLGQDPADIDAARLKKQEELARQIVVNRGASWSHATDATALPVAVKIFGVKALPTKILIGRDGKVVARIKRVEELDHILPGLL